MVWYTVHIEYCVCRFLGLDLLDVIIHICIPQHCKDNTIHHCFYHVSTFISVVKMYVAILILLLGNRLM